MNEYTVEVPYTYVGRDGYYQGYDIQKFVEKAKNSEDARKIARERMTHPRIVEIHGVFVHEVWKDDA